MAFGERFLTVPDLFPARIAGEPWGEGALELDLPAGPYRVRGLSERQIGALGERYAPYRRAARSADGTSLRVFRAPESDFRPIDTRGWTYSMDFDHRPAEVRVAGHRWMGLICLGDEPRAALWTAVDEDVRFAELFENFFRIVVAYRVLATGGVLLHSSGVVDGGGAIVFFGHSGAGKTTVARMALDHGRTVLSDDVNALFRVDGELLAQRMPFAGELGPTGGSLEPYPLRALCRLEKADGNETRAMSRATALAALLACAPFLNHDPHRVGSLTEALHRITGEVPALTLAFDLSGDFWGCLEEAV